MRNNRRNAQAEALPWAAIRISAGFTQEQLARRLDIGTATLRRFESGATAPLVGDITRNRLALSYRDLERTTAARLAPAAPMTEVTK